MTQDRSVSNFTAEEAKAADTRKSLAEESNTGNSKLNQPRRTADISHPIQTKKAVVNTRSIQLLATLLCCSILFALSSDGFLRHHTNLSLALTDAQALIARNALNGSCEYPEYPLLGTTVSGGIVWQAVSFAVVLSALVSVIALWDSFSDEDEDIRATTFILNGMGGLLGICFFIAYLFEPDSPDQCHGDECWSNSLFYLGVVVSLPISSAILTVWFHRGSRGLLREIQAIAALLGSLILASSSDGEVKPMKEKRSSQ